MSEQNNDAQLTDAERAHVMGLAMRGAVFWGGIVEVISIVFLTVSAISQSSLPAGNEWYVLLNGPIVLAAYFIIKRASLLDRSATTRRDKQRKIINEEVVRPLQLADAQSLKKKCSPYNRRIGCGSGGGHSFKSLRSLERIRRIVYDGFSVGHGGL